ncbi:MAG: phosphomethylpyrimidine synthase ThiC, partial [Methanoculleus sp.]|nr:phosphomethylpyrimidine synthase ThiC [Methanoculleus sp.]
EARRALDWEKQFETALVPEEARRIHERDGEIETCSMCGDLCAIKMVRDILKAPPKDRPEP